MDKSTDSTLQAQRFMAIDRGFKAAGIVADMMLDALQQQHPNRAGTLVQAIEAGMRLQIGFIFSTQEAKAVLSVVDDYGIATELASVPCVMKDVTDVLKN